MSQTKIDIFSGFLGAGKTTLIKKLIKEAYAGEKLVLIENEFGEIGIDGGFMREAGIEITEMNSGCICCSLVGDFGKALGKVLREFTPDRILIEPSGVGKLSDVIRAAQGATAEGAALNSFTTVVDVSKCKVYMKNFGEFFNDQIENAGCIILSHTDKAGDQKVAEVVSLLKAHNDTATIVATPWNEVDGKQLLAAMERENTIAAELEHLADEAAEHHHDHDDDDGCECGHHHHDHDDEDNDHACGHRHHGHDDEDDGHACGQHHHDHNDDDSCECGHHYQDHDDDDDCECGQHHHDHDDDDGCGCGHHHDHDDEDNGHACGYHHHHHHADDVFVSWGVETTKKFTKEEIHASLCALDDAEKYGTVLRAKGIVPAVDGSWIHFDYVPGEPDVRTGGADVIGRLCVIGAELNKGAVETLFGTGV